MIPSIKVFFFLWPPGKRRQLELWKTFFFCSISLPLVGISFHTLITTWMVPSCSESTTPWPCTNVTNWCCPVSSQPLRGGWGGVQEHLLLCVWPVWVWPMDSPPSSTSAKWAAQVWAKQRQCEYPRHCWPNYHPHFLLLSVFAVKIILGFYFNQISIRSLITETVYMKLF